MYLCNNTHHSPSRPQTGTSVTIQYHLCRDKGLEGCDVSVAAGQVPLPFSSFSVPTPSLHRQTSKMRVSGWVNGRIVFSPGWLILGVKGHQHLLSAVTCLSAPFPSPCVPGGRRKVVTKLLSVLQTDLRITCFRVILDVGWDSTKCRFPSASLDLVNRISWAGPENPHF